MNNYVVECNVISKEVMVNFHVFSAGMKNWVIGNSNGRRVVTIDGCRIGCRDVEFLD